MLLKHLIKNKNKKKTLDFKKKKGKKKDYFSFPAWPIQPIIYEQQQKVLSNNK